MAEIIVTQPKAKANVITLFIKKLKIKLKLIWADS